MRVGQDAMGVGEISKALRRCGVRLTAQRAGLQS